ncbi:MAG: hypothetical protein GY947_00485 [Rhodobacteraceae bacterium]|nr:hypothetical protein [Paracoccaceae bacterium]
MKTTTSVPLWAPACTLALAVAFTAAIASHGFADDADAFELSDELQTALEEHHEDVQDLQAEIHDALAGLTAEERDAVLESYADEVQAMREEGGELRDEVAAEMEAAGLEAPEHGPGGPGGHGEEGAGPGPEGHG